MPFREELEVFWVSVSSLELVVIHEILDSNWNFALFAPNMLESGEQLLSFLIDELFDKIGSLLFPIVSDKLWKN